MQKSMVNYSTNHSLIRNTRYEGSHRNQKQSLNETNSVECIESSQSSDDKSFVELFGFDISLKYGQNNTLINGDCFDGYLSAKDREMLPHEQEWKVDDDYPAMGYPISPKNSVVDQEEYKNFFPAIPENVVRLGEKIDSMRVTDLFPVESRTEVLVVSIEDLSKFWIAQNYADLENFMEEMEKFYGKNESEYLIPDGLLEKNLYCVAALYGVYFRAVIVDCRKELDQVKLFLVDYGMARKVDRDRIFFMKQIYIKLPAQAVRARLADVQPPFKGMPWSVEACRDFRDLALRKSFMADIVEIDNIQNAVTVRLKNIHDVPITMELTTKGNAIYSNMWQKKTIRDSNCEMNVSFIHFLPTFNELESWSVPWGFETLYFENEVVTTDFFYPQYFERTINEKCINRIERKMKSHVIKKKPVRKHLLRSDVESGFDIQVMNEIAYGDL